MNHIELFAGCGGLSLGLEYCGFEMLLANELSPMAAETFAFNLLGEDLTGLAKKKKHAEKTLWLNSSHPSDNLARRLRENPQITPADEEGFSEMGKLSAIRGKLLVGSIVDLNRYIESNKSLREDLQKENIDLVSGGPPCQSFSMAGLRQHNNARNTLPMEFADFVEHTKPKIALLENVSGILRPFSVAGEKHYAWFEVARAFASKGYFPICLHVNAKYVGAAQNRPRFVLLALRSDVFIALLERHKEDESVTNCLNKIRSFFTKEKRGMPTVPFSDLDYYDIEKNADIFKSKIFLPLSTHWNSEKWVTVEDAIDELRENRRNNATSTYAENINSIFFRLRESIRALNHEKRRNSTLVQQRFKLYQNISKATSQIKSDTVKFLKSPESHELESSTVIFLLKKKFLTDNGKLEKILTTTDLKKYLTKLKTRKQTQRALISSSPAPAALSIPDDACHYHPSLLRTLSVREMARFQSFPDWFEFRSKVTTGGSMRRFEVPQYTQVGNAVPPLLGKALGEVVINILSD